MSQSGHRFILWVRVVSASVLLAGCFESGSSGGSGDTGGGASPPAPTQTNRAPVISGTPPTAVLAGESYSFRPTATDPDGDTLTFSVQNPPAWASFDASTGRLSGRPSEADVGSYSNVRITVSDGRATASLSEFAIAVNQIATGSVTLAWSPPTTNADGTAITNLAGYRIYYGTSSTNLDQVVTLNNAGTTRYVIENLSPATYYFSMTSFNTLSVESARSDTVSRTVG